VKRTKEKISRLIFYSPFVLMVFVLVLIFIATLFYNQNEFTNTMSFLVQETERLDKSGVAEEIISDSFDRYTQMVTHKTQNRTLYGLSVALGSVFIVALFFFTVFRIVIKKALHFQDELFEEKEKLQEVTEELQYANERLSYQLYIDPLTQLKNRLALEHAIETMKEPKLILLDIDSFKDINEFYGTSIGDTVLQEMASDLKGFAQEHNILLYRCGADEFALLEEVALDVERYEMLAEELVRRFKGKLIDIPTTKEPVEINIAIGFSLDSIEVFEKASMALFEAKKREIDYLCYFNKIEHTTLYAEQIKWSNFIKEALKNDTVTPYYQPIFNRNGEIIKYECLVRILNDHEEAIPPGLFLSISKKVKRYADIEKILIDKSFSYIAGTSKIISVNLLARDMSDSNISNYVVERLKHYNVAKQIVFEILEDESIENLERVSTFIDRVKRMGCQIAIDDFGTGYSNFSYLLKLKPDYIKIDGSLIKALDKDANSVAIVSAIITFARKLGIKTIAEYVHNDKVYALCLNLGIDEFQGFYLGEPRARFKE